MNDPLSTSANRPTVQHMRDTYRVTYWYAWQGYEGHPDRHELAAHEADEAVARLTRTDPQAGPSSDGPLVH